MYERTSKIQTTRAVPMQPTLQVPMTLLQLVLSLGRKIWHLNPRTRGLKLALFGM